LLIIFDLDDTLIDTSGCVTPIALKHAFEKMTGAGLTLSCPQKGFDMLRRIDRHSVTARLSLDEFLEIHHESNSFSSDSVSGSEPLSVQCLPGAIDLLAELSSEHTLVLVTIGEEKTQRLKLSLAGIDPTLFSEIFICQKKGPIYKELAERYQRPTVVIGDKIGSDLRPAKAMGFKTIHIKWGRGLNCIDESGVVDHTIWNLGDCRMLLTLIKEFSGQS